MKKLKRLLIFIYIVVFSFAIGYFSGYIDDSTANYEAIKESYGFFIHFIKLFLLALAILSQVVLHELGHLVAGLAKGYEFIMFRVGNLALVKRQEGFTLGRFNIPGTGGQALLAPKAKAYSNYSYKLYMYGGVISNLIFSFSAVFFFIFAKEYFLRVFLLYFFAMGMISAAFNGIAFSSAIANDAMNAKYMDMHEEYRIFTSYSLKLSKFLANGKGLSDFDEDEINYLKKTNFEFAEGYVLLGDYYSELLEEKLAEKYYKKH